MSQSVILLSVLTTSLSLLDVFREYLHQARAEGGALGARAPAFFQNYSKVPLSDK